MLNTESLSRELVELFEGGAPEVTLQEVQQQTLREVPRHVKPRRPLVTAAVAFVVVVLGGLLIGLVAQSSESEPAAPSPDETDSTSVLFPVSLGVDHLWPETAAQLSPVDLAEVFVAEALGWESAGGTQFSDSVPGGPVWVRVQQSGVEELVDVLTVPSSDGGWVVVEVGTPWFRGVDVSADSGGTRVSLLRLPGNVRGEVTVRLLDGRHVVAWATIEIGVSDSAYVILPDVSPESVTSILIRYVNTDGTVIAANGSSSLSLTSVSVPAAP